MKSYGQFCPIAKAAELFCERWTALVIRNLGAGATRFNDIHRGVPHMSATLLSRRLRQLEAEGLLERRRSATGKSWTYHLTASGEAFLPLVSALGDWGQKWTRRELTEGELDLGLLIWGLEFSIDRQAFGMRRRIVRLQVTDQPQHKQLYWFVCESGELDLCVTDPGGDPDIYLSANLPNLIYVYRGDISLASAIRNKQLRVDGSPRLIARLAKWLNIAPAADAVEAN